MKRELGIARCGLACCACSEEVKCRGKEICTGCNSGKCAIAEECVSLRCSREKGLKGCYECDTLCEEGVLKKTKVKGFIQFIRQYGEEKFMDCLEENQKRGIIYHREGVVGDYDTCKTPEDVVKMLLNTNEKDMEDRVKKSMLWMIAYVLLEIVAVFLLTTFIKDCSDCLYIGLIGLLYVIINLFCIKYHRERLFINGIISYFTMILMGVAISTYLLPEEAIAMGVAVSLLDVLSFTKYGKRTMNAKAMSNMNFMAKMVIYGKGKKEILYPTCGIGDYFYFAIWLAGLGKDKVMFATLATGLILGNLVNNIVINHLRKKPNYKGLPATIIPFTFLIISYLLVKGLSSLTL